MNYSHFISSVGVGDLLTDLKHPHKVLESEFYMCGTSRITIQNLTTNQVFELTEWDEKCKEFIHGPIDGEFYS